MWLAQKTVLGLIVITFLCGNSALWAESPAEEFDNAFGTDYQAVKADAKEGPRLTLAQRVLDAMQVKDTDPKMVSYLNDKVSELVGNSEKGLAIKTKSLELASAFFPEKRLAYLENALELGKRQLAAARQPAEKPTIAVKMILTAAGLADAYQEARQYDAVLKTCKMVLPIAKQYSGDDVPKFESRIAEACHVKALRITESQWTAKIKSAPTDAKTRSSLVMLCLKDLDDPADAANYLLAEDHSESATNTRLAAEGSAGMSPSTTLALAQWYFTLSAQGKPEVRLAMANRSQGYYGRYLGLPSDDDLAHAKVQAELEKVEAMINQLSQSSGNLLALIDPKKNLLQGQAWQSPKGLVMNGYTPQGSVMVPVAVDGGSYEVTVKYMIVEGMNGITIGLPVGKSRGDLWIDGGEGRTCGLGNINGVAYFLNKTKVDRSFGSAGRNIPMTVKATVRVIGNTAQIKATLNDNALLTWTGKPGDLSPGFKTDKPEAFLLGCWGSRLVVSSVEIKVLSGKLRKLGSEHSEHPAEHAEHPEH